MEQQPQSNKRQFMLPQHRYHGDINVRRLVFNSNLQEFTNRTQLICSLETNGKIEPLEAFAQIEDLWEQLKQSRMTLDLN